MTSILARILLPAERLTAALTDPARRERTAVLVLLAYAAVWALYGVLAKGSQDIHFDMGEVVAWSRDLDWGYAKHPPLAAWLARAWFTVFPLTDWSYYLFAMSLAALALWFVWRIAADYLDAEKRVVAFTLLMFVPFLNFHALKFNVNTVMIPTWAAVTYFFLRSLDTRSRRYAVLAGIAAAAAMLAKYWSILLLLGLAAAAFVHPQRRAYFRSAAPWLTVAFGALALAPHVWWLFATGFESFGYATGSHPVETRWQAALTGLGYVGGALGTAAAAIVLVPIVARPGLRALSDTLWPVDLRRRALVVAFAVPLLLPALAAVVTRSAVVSIWAMASLTLLPVVLLSSPLLAIPRAAIVNLVALAVGFPLVMLAAAVPVATAIHERGVPKSMDHYSLLAAEIDRAWRGATDRPLRFVGGDPVLAFGMSFYLADRPSTFNEFDDRARPATDPAHVLRDGIAMACLAADKACVAAIRSREATSGATRRSEVELARTYRGATGRPSRYLISIVPPR